MRLRVAIVCLLICLGATLLWLRWATSIRASNMSSLENAYALRIVGLAAMSYLEETRSWPPSLEALLAAGHLREYANGIVDSFPDRTGGVSGNLVRRVTLHADDRAGCMMVDGILLNQAGKEVTFVSTADVSESESRNVNRSLAQRRWDYYRQSDAGSEP